MELAELLQQTGAGGQDPELYLRQTLAQHSDPRVRAIAEWAAQQSAASQQTIDVEAEPPVPEQIAEARPDRRIRRRIRALERELDYQREIGDTLAAALGACYLCWGDDSGCEECSGQGTPGWRAPDAELFEVYVAPAAERIQKHRNAARTGRVREQQPNDPLIERSPS